MIEGLLAIGVIALVAWGMAWLANKIAPIDRSGGGPDAPA